MTMQGNFKRSQDDPKTETDSTTKIEVGAFEAMI